MINYDIVLNIFWLRRHNSVINWTEKNFKKLIKFEKCHYVITIQFTHRQRSMMNKKQTTAKREFAISIKNDIQNRFDSLNIDKNQLNHDNKIIDKNYAFTKIRENINDTTQKSLKMISNVYKKWIHLFRKKKSTKIFLNTNRKIMKSN